MNIYVDYPISAADRPILEEATGGDAVWLARDAPSPDRSRKAFLEAEVAFGDVPRELLSQSTRLRWLQLPSVGCDYYRSIDWAALGSRITCTNLRGVFTDAVLQTTLAGILGHYRGIDRLVRYQGQRDWRKMELRPRLRILGGAHVLLLGAGDLASALRASLSRFGCTFTVYARTQGDIHSAAELDAALPAADIVCAALPDTPATRGLLDRARFARFKPGALFVNVGRGTLVDETALLDALRTGRLAGAVLDVTRREPLPPDDPLWLVPNVLLTQHTAAGSEQEFTDSLKFFVRNLDRYRAGTPLVNAVDWKRGY